MLLALLLTTASLAHAADSLECGATRDGQQAVVQARAEFADGVAQAALQPSANALGLGLDASLSPQSLFLVLEDPAKLTRAAFTASPNGATAEGFTLQNGGARVQCSKKVEKPVGVFPARPGLPEYFVCVLDELKYVQGSVAETKRLALKAISTALFRLPVSISAKGSGAAFAVKLNRNDFLRGLEVSLGEDSGKGARYSGPANTLSAGFLLGLTIGNRAEEARFLRLGCAYANDPAAFGK